MKRLDLSMPGYHFPIRLGKVRVDWLLLKSFYNTNCSLYRTWKKNLADHDFHALITVTFALLLLNDRLSDPY